MSIKIITLYSCSNCGAQFSKWNGRCLECGAWGSLKKEIIDEKQELREKQLADISAVEMVDLKKVTEREKNRIHTGINEVDRVLGGGIVPGSLILLAGEPGIGKSTLIAQIAGKNMIYVSGEESAPQVKARLDRLGASTEFKFISETNIEKIIETAKRAEKIGLLIIDSIQTVYSSLVPSESGSLNQIRACAISLLEFSKNSNTPVIITGHITKDGQVAGPKTLEHIVDTVLYLENEPNQSYSVLRATKNRFGSINEIGIFEMTGSGFKEIANPSGFFIEESMDNITGACVGCVMEGTRPFFVEVQALVSKTSFGYPQRKSSGFDLNRLQVLCAVLTKRTKVNLSNQDVILNITGGLKVSDTSLDLAICAAIISSLLNQTVNKKIVFLGEVGLGGEVRKISKINERLKEAEKLGFTTAILPNVKFKSNKIKLVNLPSLEELVKYLTKS